MKPGRSIHNPLHAPRWPALSRPLVIAAAILAVVFWILQRPTSTRLGLDFRVTQLSIPLYAKALAFLHRDAEYRLLSRRIVAGQPTEEARLVAILAWTGDHIRRTPTDWPIEDDHVWHIIVRGHGLPDQAADVVATLSSYAGVRAFWRPLRLADGTTCVATLARLDNRWALIDVGGAGLVREQGGAPLDIAHAVDDPAYADAHRDAIQAAGIAEWLPSLRPFAVPDVTRAEQQMPWPRLGYELRRALGGHPTSAALRVEMAIA